MAAAAKNSSTARVLVSASGSTSREWLPTSSSKRCWWPGGSILGQHRQLEEAQLIAASHNSAAIALTPPCRLLLGPYRARSWTSLGGSSNSSARSSCAGWRPPHLLRLLGDDLIDPAFLDLGVEDADSGRLAAVALELGAACQARSSTPAVGSISSTPRSFRVASSSSRLPLPDDDAAAQQRQLAGRPVSPAAQRARCSGVRRASRCNAWRPRSTISAPSVTLISTPSTPGGSALVRSVDMGQLSRNGGLLATPEIWRSTVVEPTASASRSTWLIVASDQGEAVQAIALSGSALNRSVLRQRMSRSPWNFGGGPAGDQAASSLAGVTSVMVASRAAGGWAGAGSR